MSKNSLIIIISGKQYSGKDTVADVICETLPGLKREALATAIKNEFGNQKNLTFNEIDRNKTLYRSDLIELGNEKRKECPDYWIKKVLMDDGDVVITDVRLQHEYDTFKKMGAITVRVESDREERLKRGHLVREDDLTETDLDNIKDWDYVITNDSDIEALKNSAAKVALALEKKLFTKK